MGRHAQHSVIVSTEYSLRFAGQKCRHGKSNAGRTASLTVAALVVLVCAGGRLFLVLHDLFHLGGKITNDRWTLSRHEVPNDLTIFNLRLGSFPRLSAIIYHYPISTLSTVVDTSAQPVSAAAAANAELCLVKLRFSLKRRAIN